jgi:hypothetical protein
LTSALLALFAGLLASSVPTAATAQAALKAPKASTAAFGVQAATHGTLDGRAQLTYGATPGAQLADQVAVVNLGSKPLTLQVYATDASSGQDGSFALLPSTEKAKDLGSWITLGGAGSVRVPARTSHGPSFVVLPLKLTVPKNATPGDHAAGVVVSLVGTAKNKLGVDVKLDQRVAIRVYARVSGTLRPGLAIEDLHVGYSNPSLFGNPFGSGTATVSYRVHNTGNVLLGATQNLTISSSLGGTTHVKGLPIVPPLLPGASVEITRSVPGVFPGLHISAKVRLTPIAPPGVTDPKLSAVEASTSVWAFPWALIVLILLVAAAVGLLIWRQRRLNARPPDAPTSHRAKVAK